MLTNLLAALCLALIPAVAQPCISADFSLAMRLDVPGSSDASYWVSLTAIDSGTNDTLFLVGERLSRYPGSPVALSGKSGSASLAVKIDAINSHCGTIQQGSFGLSVPDLGERYGASTPILASKGESWPHFFYSNDSVNPELTAASQNWYVCDHDIRGQSYLTLSFGVYNENGTSPYGCTPTEVKQVYNILCAND